MQYKKEILKENFEKKPHQGHGGILITEGFQDRTGHDAKETLLGSLVH